MEGGNHDLIVQILHDVHSLNHDMSRLSAWLGKTAMDLDLRELVALRVRHCAQQIAGACAADHVQQLQCLTTMFNVVLLRLVACRNLPDSGAATCRIDVKSGGQVVLKSPAVDVAAGNPRWAPDSYVLASDHFEESIELQIVGLDRTGAEINLGNAKLRLSYKGCGEWINAQRQVHEGTHLEYEVFFARDVPHLSQARAVRP